ncbi:MAG: methyl-accepting chemotaxis protein, partial [Gammaproteobacteria bacterium]|nr:methyl-accepting chemotaxis protein [Gammaproteobacteria bacterium]
TRTQESTKEVAEIITRLQEGSERAVTAMEEGHNQAGEGVEFTERTAEALAEISGALSVIVTMNTQIANAAKEQSTVAESINANIHSVNLSAENTSQSTREVSKACDRVSKLSIRLKGIVGDFKT